MLSTRPEEVRAVTAWIEEAEATGRGGPVYKDITYQSDCVSAAREYELNAANEQMRRLSKLKLFQEEVKRRVKRIELEKRRAETNVSLKNVEFQRLGDVGRDKLPDDDLVIETIRENADIRNVAEMLRQSKAQLRSILTDKKMTFGESSRLNESLPSASKEIFLRSAVATERLKHQMYHAPLKYAATDLTKSINLLFANNPVNEKLLENEKRKLYRKLASDEERQKVRERRQTVVDNGVRKLRADREQARAMAEWKQRNQGKLQEMQATLVKAEKSRELSLKKTEELRYIDSLKRDINKISQENYCELPQLCLCSQDLFNFGEKCANNCRFRRDRKEVIVALESLLLQLKAERIPDPKFLSSFH